MAALAGLAVILGGSGGGSNKPAAVKQAAQKVQKAAPGKGPNVGKPNKQGVSKLSQARHT